MKDYPSLFRGEKVILKEYRRAQQFARTRQAWEAAMPWLVRNPNACPMYAKRTTLGVKLSRPKESDNLRAHHARQRRAAWVRLALLLAVLAWPVWRLAWWVGWRWADLF